MALTAQAPTSILPSEIAEAVRCMNDVQRDISRHIVGNEYLIRISAVALVSGANLFMQGAPGIVKTMLGKMWAARLHGRFHRTLYGPFQEPAHVFGIEDPKAFMEGRYERVKRGSVTDADIHFADELFRASDAMKDSILDLFDEQPKYEEMGETCYLRLLLVMSASNSLPGPDDEALADRLVFQVPVAKLPEREDRVEIALRHLATRRGDLPEEPQAYISIDQVRILREYAKTDVEVPAGIIEKLVTLDYEMAEKLGIEVSPRTVNRCLDILQATALLSERTVVTNKDFGILQYVVAPIPDQPRARDLILELTAPLEKKALEIAGVLTRQVGEWRALANHPDKRNRARAKQGGQDLMNDLADYREQLDSLAQQAHQDGYDAEAIEQIIAQVDTHTGNTSLKIRDLYRELPKSDDES